ncbi:class I SAM-dependent methyltransferase [Pedobacter xixiisoli]|uniref:Methyltransferase domain-containing protein n=1 Tax=Pedobacter xixiisoli TaxID=1476464 RepID=A0A285ZUP8_9SPHI|nr:class I SAM-dependent methyltransferase [Pedobacter xixiisoli]SOD13370.1 hypothetical protein SAMN06297358_1197 [Pedobacter xixiisoli]
MTVSKLSAITKTILQSRTPNEEVHAIQSLSDFYLAFRSNRSPQPSDQAEKVLKGGIALSFDHAADCLQDYYRTARFIKGTYLAIQELLLRFPNQKINILYAGCGPFATILLPILPLFKPNQLQVTLIDIHPESVKFVKELFTQLDLLSFVDCISVEDAISYRYPNSNLHMVISETMFHALLVEPQVAITRNLAPQLVNGGIFIPEEVTIEAIITSFSKEPFLYNAAAPVVSAITERSLMAKLFSLNKNSASVSFSNQEYRSPRLKVPVFQNSSPDICLFTHVKIFSKLELGPSESLITNPYCLVSMLNLPSGSSISFIYEFTEVPSWSYQLAD